MSSAFVMVLCSDVRVREGEGRGSLKDIVLVVFIEVSGLSPHTGYGRIS